MIIAIADILVISTFSAIPQPREKTNESPLRSNLKVLFDFTKDEDAGNADWTIDGAYSDFANTLRNDGFEVDSLGDGTGTITSADLEGYNVLVIPEPQDRFYSSEINVITDFVHNGGGLVYIADHNNSDRNNNGWDSWHIWNDNLNSDSRFNITLTPTESGTGTNNEVTDISPVPTLTVNVNSFGIWSGTTMKVSGIAEIAANQTINGDKYPVLAYTYYGSGRIVVHCDSSTFDDGTPDNNNENDTLYDGWSKYDDSTLGVDLVNWAAGLNSSNSNLPLNSHPGSSPATSYGDGNYLVAYVNGSTVNGYFVNSSTGEQGNELQIYKYGAGVRTAYNDDGKNFTVVSFDYSLPSYHKIINRFITPNSENSTYGESISNDANKSVDVSYGAHRILFTWINLTREQVEGRFYDTQTGTFGQNFTIATNSVEKYSISVGFDQQSGKFLVVWTENYDIRGVFITGDGSITPVNFPTTPSIKESQLSVAGGNGEFFVTYRNGSFSSSTGAYFIIVSSDGNVGEVHKINDNNANYCGKVDVEFSSGDFMLAFSDQRNGNADVFLRVYNSSGSMVGDEMNVTSSSNSEETPSAATDGASKIVVWNNYVSSSNQNVEGRFYPVENVPELTWLFVILLLFLIVVIRRVQ